MRAAALVLLTLVAPASAGPLDRTGTDRATKPPQERSILSSQSAEEAAARQAEFDRQIAQRSQRAARSICTGCGAGTGGSAVTPRLRNPVRDEARPADPAEAPTD